MRKKNISIDYENYGSSAELWSIKYISHLIENQSTLANFINTYFEADETSCFEWLNEFIDHVFSMSDEIKTVLFQRKIIPVQTGAFRDYTEFTRLEDNPKYFEESIKDIYKNFTGKGDPRAFLIDSRIQVGDIKKVSIDILTTEIDKLFDDLTIETKVKKGNILYDSFLNLNNWFEQFPEAVSNLKTFATKRATLYVIALGEGFGKQVMSLRDSGRSMDDIVELAKVSLTTAEIKALEMVAIELGTGNLLAKAQQLIDVKNQRIRWQKIGKSAEDAFKQVFEGLQLDVELSNPDVGKDFELTLKAKGYSIEIKNVIEGKENVRMSILQGRTAVLGKENYALCVMTRPNDEAEIDERYFITHGRFVIDIGFQIGDKIKKWDDGLFNLSSNDTIKVSLDDKTETVYVNRSIWRDGISFPDFVTVLKRHFEKESY